jgi:WD40 repeat protein
MEFPDFFADVWSLDVNSHGSSMIAVSADYSIRIYNISSEQVLPDWEKEKKLDKTIEEEFQKELDANHVNVNSMNKEIEKIIPIKKSMDNISFAEDLMDSLDLAEKFKNDVYQYEISVEEYAKSLEMLRNKNSKKLKVFNLEEPELPKSSMMMLGKNIFDYIMFKLKSIRNSELENSLNNLPYSYVQTLFFYMEYYIRNVRLFFIHYFILFYFTY